MISIVYVLKHVFCSDCAVKTHTQNSDCIVSNKRCIVFNSRAAKMDEARIVENHWQILLIPACQFQSCKSSVHPSSFAAHIAHLYYILVLYERNQTQKTPAKKKPKPRERREDLKRQRAQDKQPPSTSKNGRLKTKSAD